MTRSNSPLRLGILGMSAGNGHPYSWSAIFNGYDRATMSTCPFPGIPAYLGQRKFPEEFLSELGRVSHVWTQDRDLSEHIAQATLIQHVVNTPDEMIGHVDAVLLARDDAENHLRLAEPFLTGGLPIFVDKPLALRLSDADKLLAMQKYEGQLFSCSALRYGAEFQVDAQERAEIGDVRLVEATTPKGWATYAVHVIEPILANFGREWGFPLPTRSRMVLHARDMTRLTVALDGDVVLSVTTTGSAAAPIGFRIHGSKGVREHVFNDSFSAFRAALAAFIQGISTGEVPISRAETRQVISCIEWGLPGAGQGL